MFEQIAGLAASVGTSGLSSILGGITGFAGAFFQRRHEMAQAELELRRHQQDQEHQIRVMDKEADNATRLARARMDETALKGDYEGLHKSLDAEAAGAVFSRMWAEKLNTSGTMGALVGGIIATLLGLVDVIRGLTRPAITCYLVWATARIWADIMNQLGGITALQPDMQLNLAVAVVNMVLYLTCTAVGWWFGTRGGGQSVKR